MSDSDSRRTTEKQKEAIESGQRAAMRTFQFPVEQMIQFQREGMKMFIDGLEAQERTQKRNIEAVKTAFNDYLGAVESLSEGMTSAADETISAAAETQETALEAGSRRGEGQSDQAGSPRAGAQHAGGQQAGGQVGGSSGYQEGVQLQATDYGQADRTPTRQQGTGSSGRGSQQGAGVQQDVGYRQGQQPSTQQQGAPTSTYQQDTSVGGQGRGGGQQGTTYQQDVEFRGSGPGGTSPQEAGVQYGQTRWRGGGQRSRRGSEERTGGERQRQPTGYDEPGSEIQPR